MSELIQFVLLGLATGAVYALTAEGLVLVYRGSGVVNFAQGGLGMLGAFLYYEGRSSGWSAAVAWSVALGLPAVLSALIHLGIMTRLRRASPLVRLVATLGVLFLLLAVANRLWTEAPRSVTSPLPTTLRHPFGESITISEDRLWLLAIAAAVTVVLGAAYRWTRFGQATEAVAENPVAASALGLSPDAIAAGNWAIGGALAALAGILVAPILLLQTTALAFVVLRALAAALVGRFRSFSLTFAGALAIGVVESLLSRYVANDGPLASVTSDEGFLFGWFSAQATSRSAAFLMIVVVLVAAGRALPVRGELLDRLPRLGTGRVHRLGVTLAVAAGAGVLLTVPDDWATASVVTLASALVLLSFVVVTGYVGQLSLAQLTLGGFGAWVAGRLLVAAGWPFPLALVAAVVLTVPVGVLVAVPALRARGVNLAVLTFGLSVIVFELVLANPQLTGGFEGTVVGELTMVGVDVDAARHPGRYGLLVLAALVVASLGVANLRRGPVGRRLVAVRSNERAAASLGIDVQGAKLFAFGLGAGIAALGGIFLAFHQRTVAYAAFGPAPSVEFVVYAVIGGIGFLAGPLVGAILVAGGLGARLATTVGLDGDALEILAGVQLIATLLANPDGVAGVLGRRRSRRRGGRSTAVVDQAPDGCATRRPPAALVLDAVRVGFGGVVAVDDVSFAVRPGEVVGLIGPNGAGKTTLIDAVTGFVPARGGVRLGDVPVEGWPASRRARAGLARSFQSVELFEDLTVAENLLAACEDRSRRRYATALLPPGRPALTPLASAAVRDLGLADELDRLPHELSHGRRRLVALARSIAAGPSVLLLDEPAAGLGAGERVELGAIVTRLAREWGLAILLVEHDVSLVMGVCDRIVVLEFGSVIASGPPADVAADPAVVAAYLGAPDPDPGPVTGAATGGPAAAPPASPRPLPR